MYIICQTIAEAIVAYYAKYFDAVSAFEFKKLVSYDRTASDGDQEVRWTGYTYTDKIGAYTYILLLCIAYIRTFIAFIFKTTRTVSVVSVTCARNNSYSTASTCQHIQHVVHLARFHSRLLRFQRTRLDVR